MQAFNNTEFDLLASLQALIIYSTIILFPRGESVHHGVDEERLILSFQDLTLGLAANGLSLEEERDGQVPTWHSWAFMSAKRRSLLAVYFLTWAWSSSRGYPTFHCRELGLVLAPDTKSLWQARSYEAWRPLYETWQSRWQGNGYRIGETFVIPPQAELDERTQTWLEEADEFGMLLMTTGMEGSTRLSLTLIMLVNAV